jgi:hypothetical protein
MSCTSQIVSVLHDVLRHVDGGISVHAVVLDFSKAFDVVSHHIIITKLIKHQINPVLSHWIAAFLSNRKQAVVVGGTTSSVVEVSSDVPQGSVLGPALFILFINDIVNSVQKCSIKLFADDTLIYLPVTSPNCTASLQTDLDNLFQWSLTNGMKFNADKSSVIRFKSRSNFPAHYSLGGTNITEVESVKYLGILLSHDLKWVTHVDSIVHKATKILGLLKHSLCYAPQEVKLLAYKTLCRPLLEYACEAWNPSGSGLSHKLENIQSKALRFIYNVKGRETSITTLRNKAELSSLAKRRQDKRIKLFHHILEHQSSFPALNSSLEEMTPAHNIHTRSDSFLSLSCSTNKFLNSFLVRTARELRTGDLIVDN